VQDYVRALIASGANVEAAQLVMQEHLTDADLISTLAGCGDPEFAEYAERLMMRSSPRPLAETNPELHARLMDVPIPTVEIMDEVAAIRNCCTFDEEFRNRVDAYVVAHPEDFERWREELHPNVVVPLLNDKEETAEFALKIAPLGDSELCHILAALESRGLDFCVANSPPIHPYHFTGEKRRAFEEKLASYDIFVGEGEIGTEEQPLDDSRYMSELEKTQGEALTPERTIALIKLYEWEVSVAKVIDELRAQVDVFLGSKQTGELPPWIEDSMHAEKTGMRSRDGTPEPCDNWGIPIELTTCPICGMKHNLGESVASVAVFPCGHTYHVSCLHTRHCPVCYSGCMD
jgi:hypothetical protein